MTHKRAPFAFVLVFLFCRNVFAFELDRSQIAIQAKIYPQLIFFTTKTKELNPQKPIVIVAAYTEATKRVAEIFKEESEKLYKDGIKGYSITIKLVPRNRLTKEKEYVGSYLLFDDEDNSKAYDIADLEGVMTFAATKKIFEKNGALFFVEVTNKTTILLNKKALSSSGLSFDLSLLKIVRIYDE